MAPVDRKRTSEDIVRVAGIAISHPDRIVYPTLGLTKGDIVRYYDIVADVMLPHLKGRPLTLQQCTPDAEQCRYLRHSGSRAPDGVRIVSIQEKTKVGDYMIVDNKRALIALAQWNILELHTWNAQAARLETPDRVVLDLDPGPQVPWREIVAAARLVRQILQQLDLESWIKTTGGRGLHVVVPLRPTTWMACLEFARTVAEAIVEHDPTRYTTKFAKAGRERQILIDYLRNNRTNTAVAAYSARARPGATVSMPLQWEELTPRADPSRWTVQSVPVRLAKAGDAWADYWKVRQRLPGPSRHAQPVARRATRALR